MLTQGVLPFKLEVTDETITPHAGLAIFGEFMHALGLPGALDRVLPGPGSAAGYLPSQFVTPLFLMLHGGGRALEDLRQIREDAGLRALLKLTEMPSSDATGDWLRRMGKKDGLAALEALNRQMVRRGLNGEDRKDYTLDIDVTRVMAEKQAAAWTYKGERGYAPMVGHLAENGLVIGDEFREGNDAPQSRNLEFIQHCATQLPKGKRIAFLRADSAAYQAAIFNWCDEKGVQFADWGRYGCGGEGGGKGDSRRGLAGA